MIGEFNENLPPFDALPEHSALVISRERIAIEEIETDGTNWLRNPSFELGVVVGAAAGVVAASLISEVEKRNGVDIAPLAEKGIIGVVAVGFVLGTKKFFRFASEVFTEDTPTQD